jgi:acetylornithine/N-succinyldiaminopimelate aminotransferase
MLGIECGPANTELVDLAREEGLIAVVAGENILRLVPPLIIDESHVAEAIAILDKVAGRVEQ